MAKVDLSTADVGQVLPELEFGPVSRTLLALYAGASGDHNPAHIDINFARKAGLPDVFAHGMLSYGVLAQVVTQWAGVGRVREFGARFVSITQVRDRITCKATIVERFEVDGEMRVKLAVLATAQDGRETLSGEAVVAT